MNSVSYAHCAVLPSLMLSFEFMTFVIQEGKAYLEKNLTEWKKPILIDRIDRAAKKTTFKV